MTLPLSLQPSDMAHHARWQQQRYMTQHGSPSHLVGWISEHLLSIFKESVCQSHTERDTVQGSGTHAPGSVLCVAETIGQATDQNSLHWLQVVSPNLTVSHHLLVQIRDAAWTSFS